MTSDILEKIEALCIKDENGCLVWQGATSDGYGRIHIRRRRCRAHRVAYEIVKGPVPEGLVLDHLCRNRACCNPDHLEPVTNRENVMRGETLAARHAAVTHCPRGHEYTAENTRIYNRKRHCRECERERVTARCERMRAAGFVYRTKDGKRQWVRAAQGERD